MTAAPLLGSCLCGGVRYQIDGPLSPIDLCHCGMCRKAHGTAYSSNAVAAAADFRWLAGTALLTEYASSPHRRKYFCRQCGSQLQIRRTDRPEIVVVCMGSLDSPTDSRPAHHVFCDARADWDEPGADLPRYRIYPGHEPEDTPA
ncbi:GFA family protein [Chitinimonas viridis]|uniref:GFA family protein n=1 Tax=Chitinimonas viridis TaxID=664880 RepID=A0ABT8B866_9NEIS|nr:GFA family protein [Chitinimonas viridis]MDN3578235.1 GFA family protein [Chitinimonas viridis]